MSEAWGGVEACRRGFELRTTESVPDFGGNYVLTWEGSRPGILWFGSRTRYSETPVGKEPEEGPTPR